MVVGHSSLKRRDGPDSPLSILHLARLVLGVGVGKSMHDLLDCACLWKEWSDESCGGFKCMTQHGHVSSFAQACQLHVAVSRQGLVIWAIQKNAQLGGFIGVFVAAALASRRPEFVNDALQQ